MKAQRAKVHMRREDLLILSGSAMLEAQVLENWMKTPPVEEMPEDVKAKWLEKLQQTADRCREAAARAVQLVAKCDELGLWQEVDL